jgi:transposase-like protein
MIANAEWSEARRLKRRTPLPEFKSKVTLAAIKGDLTVEEMVKKFDIQPDQITEWKTQLLD